MKQSSLIILKFIFCCLLISPNLSAQRVRISSTGNLNFGSFSVRNGGTITVAPDGSTSTTGDIILVNFRTSPSKATIALYTKANNGILVTVSADPITLTGPGGSLQLSVIFDRNSLILNKDITEYIEMGGTLTVGPEDTRGMYFVADVPITFSYQ